VSLAEIVNPVLSGLAWLCYIVLSIYILRIGVFIVRGKEAKDSHRMREAMAMGYTIFAAFYISSSIVALNPFVQNVLQVVSLLRMQPSSWINSLIALCAGSVCAAFICNFSRSLWMLKSLDHGQFEAVPEWGDLFSTSGRRFFEFSTRAIAATLFISLELEFEKLGTYSPEDVIRSSTVVPIHLDRVGLVGMLLYLSLMAWWVVGWVVAKKKMPKRALTFYFAGLVISYFLFSYGGLEVNKDPDKAISLLLSVFVVTMAALYMLLFVLSDVIRVLFRAGRAAPGAVCNAYAGLRNRFRLPGPI
jgi:hypothetical protein